MFKFFGLCRYTLLVKRSGRVLPPFNWVDVADLDYSNQQLRIYLIECILFWTCEVDVDGLRCDVESLVPDDFWNQARGKSFYAGSYK